MVENIKSRVKILEDEGEKIAIIFCPGCKNNHPFRVRSQDKNSIWKWNGDHIKPTFQPSLLVNKTYEELRCHSFVKDGNIQFLNDCFHELKGQTVPLPFLNEDWEPLIEKDDYTRDKSGGVSDGDG